MVARTGALLQCHGRIVWLAGDWIHAATIIKWDRRGKLRHFRFLDQKVRRFFA